MVAKTDFEYKDADTWFEVNAADPDLSPIIITLPIPPPEELIDGFGLHPDEQYFRRKIVPPKLKSLEERALENCRAIEEKNQQKVVTGYKVYLEYWRILEEEQEYYKNELEWMQRIWWHRINGYWYFNDGKPTYITGDHFDYLNFWTDTDGTYFEYRDRERRKRLFLQYLERTQETFAVIDRETNTAMKTNGKYEMKDMGSRLFFGHAEVKSRRSGATHEACHKVWKGNSTTPGAYGTIVSMEGDNAEKHYYKKLIPAWQRYPMFLKPIWQGSNSPTTLKMVAPNNLYGFEGLQSMIDYTNSAGERKNDGDKLFYSLFDESGKTLNADILERWSVNKLAMSTGGGSNIIGYSHHPSTVEEMNEGGIEYHKLCELSHFYQRNPMGQTLSGLARIFFPTWDGLEGFIDRFGMSVVDEPTERQMRLRPDAKFAKMGKGAKQVRTERGDALLREGTPAAMESFRSLRRKEPTCWADCWIGTSGDMGWDLEKIDKRLAEIRRLKSLRKTPYVRGNFIWEAGLKDGKVIWVGDEENGKFELAMKLTPEESNQRNQIMWFDGETGYPVPAWEPRHKSKFTAGADPFRYANKGEAKFHDTGSRQSDGGIAILWEHDHTVDRGTVIEEWKSRTFVLSYRNRPRAQDEYNEDVLMACVYFGALLYPETNVDDLFKYFIQRGYAGYLKYDMDALTGMRKNRPGFFSGAATKQALFSELKDYISYRSHEEPFDEFLQECKDIRGIEEMTKYDRLTAHGAALLGSKSNYGKIMDMAQGIKINTRSSGMFRKRSF